MILEHWGESCISDFIEKPPANMKNLQGVYYYYYYYYYY